MALSGRFLIFKNNFFTMKNNLIIVWAAGGVAVGAIVWMITAMPGSPATPAATPAPATVAAATVPTGNEQVFEINVKEGYTPKEITAKAGIPVILKMKTQGTFDCSSTFAIPQLNIRESLQATGEKSITIPAQKAGATVQGVCGMGMYSLVIKFT